MNEQKNTELVQKVYELFRNGDESFLKGFADDISWELPEMKNVPYAGTFNGIEAVTDFLHVLAKPRKV